MRSITKIRVVLVSIVIALVLSISNVNYKQISNENNSNLSNAETESITLNQPDIRISGDNDFSELWVSGAIGSVEAISVGDQDGDGKGEIIVGAGTYIKVFEYNATYNNYTNVYTSEWIGSPYAVCTGDDLDKDGKKEIIGGHFSSNYFNVREFNGNDNGYDKVYQHSLGSGGATEDICTGNDLDGDGRMEIIIGDGVYLNVSEYNDADDAYTNVWESGSIGWIQDVCSTNDLDDDGKAEIIAASGKTYIFENSAPDAFTEVWSKNDNAYCVCIGNDLDKDGKKEIVVGSSDSIAIVYEYNKTDNGYEQVWNSSGKATNVRAVCIGNDLDGDGNNEIITGSKNGNVTIFEYNGTDNGYSKIWDSGTKIGDKLIENMAVADDHNKDGKQELIITTNTLPPNRLYIFQHDDTVPSAPPSPTYIFIEDDDDDDDNDGKDGIFLSNQALIIGGIISAVALAGIIIIIIILIKIKIGSGR